MTSARDLMNVVRPRVPATTDRSFAHRSSARLRVSARSTLNALVVLMALLTFFHMDTRSGVGFFFGDGRRGAGFVARRPRAKS